MMSPTIFDYGALCIVAASALVGLFRGVVREILALVGGLFAAWVAYRLADMAALWMPEALPGGWLARMAMGFLLVFVVMMLAMSMAGALLSAGLTRAGLEPTDRGLGFLFGLARGAVIVLALVIAAGFTSLPEQPFWRDAVMRPWVAQAVRAVRSWLPPEFARRLRREDTAMDPDRPAR